ncbi:hypothetical protein D1007_11997 [Hordeum vulgare]|nr:hypothetical protein D1007_11997 [Hordeum vulgare]
MVTPPSSPKADANFAAAAEFPAGPGVETLPRTPPFNKALSSTLPPAAFPRNPILPSSSSGSSPALPGSVTGVMDFKLALDGTNFQPWRNYINLLLVRYHAEDHMRASSVRRLDNQAWRDDDNTVILWFFTTVEGDLLDIVAPVGCTA